MNPSDAAEHIQETLRQEREESAAGDRFRSRTAVIIAVLAMLLAITSLGGGNVAEDMFNSNIEASNRWAFYQAKNVRQTDNLLAADALEAQLRLHADRLKAADARAIQEKIDTYRAIAARYDDEPDPADPGNPLKGDGKKQLMAQALDWQKQLETAQKKDPNFGFAEALFQIAIVLCSVSILSLSRLLLGVALTMSAAAFLLMLNGFFLFLPNLF